MPVSDDPNRGLDHGAYVPLVAMYPDADVPVLQVSMHGLDAERLFQLGQALAPLRDEGALVFGSGFLTHNMRFAFKRGIPAWAREFDEWAEGALMALPTWEHYAPVLVAAGAVADHGAKATFPITGWWMDGAFTKRSVRFG